MNPPFIVYLRNKNSPDFQYRSTVARVDQTSQGYLITFNNGKSYHYGYNNVKYYPLLSAKENVRIYENGVLNRQFDTVNYYGSYLIFSNEKYYSQPVENNSNIEICAIKEDIEQSRSVLDYFKYILEQNGEISFDFPPADAAENKDISQLSTTIQLRALENIDLQESRSALSNYIDKKNPTLPFPGNLIFPFGCNESQKLAVETSITNSMSIIEGPPGTGKTQTILNIIANLLMQENSVAIVSNNNSAVFNVREKFAKVGYGSLVASLGNKKNKEEFFDTITEQDSLPESSISEENLNNTKEKLSRLDDLLTTSFKKRNKLAILQTKLSDAKTEFRHLQKEQPIDTDVKTTISKLFYRKWDLDKVIKVQNILSYYQLINRFTWSQKLRFIFQFGLYDFKSLSRYSDELTLFLNHEFYELYIASVEKEISLLSEWLELHNEKENLNQFTDISREIFNYTLHKREKKLHKSGFDKENHLNQFNQFIENYPIVLSSTLSLHTSIPKGYLFDYLIIDESSQVDIIKASICFSCTRNVVIVGDSMQLSHIVDEQSQNASEQFRLKNKIPAAYDYVNQNILTSLKTLYADDIQSVLLKEHYRCHPAIIGFCNKKYYDNQLVIMTKGDHDPFKIIETSITGERNNYNQRQIDETDYYIRQNYPDNFAAVGVIAPYRNHANKLQNQLPKDTEADTIHKFQGREKEVIIFNTVRGKINPFMDNPNLINVAVSRAVKEFVIVKPESMELQHGTNIGDLIRYINYTSNSKETVLKGSISSVFDLLYKEYNKAFEAFISENRAIDGSAAEIIIYKLLNEKILTDNPQFSSIKMAREYKLRDLVRNLEQFTEDEFRYIKNNARLDFLLYNKLDKTPVLAIEVDGVSFHDNEIQQERDSKKNNILQTIGLPLLRLSTAGHNEEERIIESLRLAMGI